MRRPPYAETIILCALGVLLCAPLGAESFASLADKARRAERRHDAGEAIQDVLTPVTWSLIEKFSIQIFTSIFGGLGFDFTITAMASPAAATRAKLCPAAAVAAPVDEGRLQAGDLV